MSAGTLRAVIYCRASLDKSGQGASVGRQEKACRALAVSREYALIGVKVDNSVSAVTGVERPAWLEVLAMVERGEVDVIIAWHLDRVTRTMRDLEQLITLAVDKNVGLVTATGDMDLTTDTGRMVARILAAVATAEIERKGERQRGANNARAAAGLPWSGGPRSFGYSQDGMSVVEDEAEAYRWAAQAALDGMPLRTIAVELGERGFTSSRSAHSKTGAAFSHSGVLRMLLSPRYAAIKMHKGIEVGLGQWPSIIDADMHRALVRKLADPTRRGRRDGGSRYTATTLLSLIARCGVCDSEECTLIATAQRGVPKYTCRSGGGCLYAPRGDLDKAVTEHVLGLLSSPGFVDSLMPRDDVRAAKAQAEIDKLYRRISVVNDDFNEGRYDDNPEEYRRIADKLREQIKAQRATLDELADVSAFAGVEVGTEAVIGQWAELPLERQRAIVERLLTITVRPTGPRVAWRAEAHAEIGRRARLRAA